MPYFYPPIHSILFCCTLANFMVYCRKGSLCNEFAVAEKIFWLYTTFFLLQNMQKLNRNCNFFLQLIFIGKILSTKEKLNFNMLVQYSNPMYWYCCTRAHGISTALLHSSTVLVLLYSSTQILYCCISTHCFGTCFDKIVDLNELQYWFLWIYVALPTWIEM